MRALKERTKFVEDWEAYEELKSRYDGEVVRYVLDHGPTEWRVQQDHLASVVLEPKCVVDAIESVDRIVTPPSPRQFPPKPRPRRELAVEHARSCGILEGWWETTDGVRFQVVNERG